MPEGDTIAKLAAYLAPRLVGRELAGGALASRPTVTLVGRRVRSVEPHGKHLFLAFEDGESLRTHLGMYGTWHRYAPGEAWKKPRAHASLWLATTDDVLVCFHAREVELGDADRARTVQRRRLGVDLLREALPGGDELLGRARALLEPTAPVVDLLLDQRIAAGIGNVYKSEALFLERLAPHTPLSRLEAERIGALFGRARDLLAANLVGGPRTTRGPAAGEEARELRAPGHLWVYGRGGQPCLRCRTPVAGARLGRGLRSTYWCPTCQS